MVRRKAESSRERVLVTGASSGIGEALARRFAQAGHDLVLVARSGDRLEALARELKRKEGVGAVAIVLDLASDGAAAKLAATLRKRRLKIDILVNNAGIACFGDFQDVPPAKHAELVRLNVVAATDVLAHFVPPMVKRGHGRVLNVASIASFLPVPTGATYAATKAYLLSLTESLSEELKGKGVTVTALCPGITATRMMDDATPGHERLLKAIGPAIASAEEVAEAGYEACMAGEVIRVPGLVNLLATQSGRVMPRWIVRNLFGLASRWVS